MVAVSSMLVWGATPREGRAVLVLDTGESSGDAKSMFQVAKVCGNAGAVAFDREKGVVVKAKGVH